MEKILLENPVEKDTETILVSITKGLLSSEYTEYILGRVKGDYPPPIIPPRLQRRKTNKQYKPRHCTITHDDNSTFDPSAITDSKLDSLSYSNVVQPMMGNKYSKGLYHDSDATEQKLDKSVHNEQSWPLTESQNTLLAKFEKIKNCLDHIFHLKG